MTTWKRFDKKDYMDGYKTYIRDSHTLLNYALKKYNIKGNVLDIGGGPATTTEFIGKDAVVYNIEPAKNCLIKKPRYKPINMSLKKALVSRNIPKNVDHIIACSSFHEIALANKKSNKENKEIMFQEINEVLKYLKKGGLFIIVFLEYKKRTTRKQVKEHLWIAEHTVGHDHPPEEFLSHEMIKRKLIGMELIESRRILQIHEYSGKKSNCIWSKLVVYNKI